MTRSATVLACAALALLPACPSGGGGPGAKPTWAKSYGGLLEDSASAGVALPDGGYVVAADRDGTGFAPTGGGETDAWLAHLDAYGDVRWERRLGNPGGSEPVLAVPARAGAAFVVSTRLYFEDSAYRRDVTVARLDAAGAIQWERRYGLDAVDGETLYFASMKPDDVPYDARPTSDGGLVFAAVSTALVTDVDDEGEVSSSRPVHVPWMARLAPNGDVLWQRQIVDDMRDYDSMGVVGFGIEVNVADHLVGAEFDATYFWINGTFPKVGIELPVVGRSEHGFHGILAAARVGMVDAGGLVRWKTSIGDRVEAGGANPWGECVFAGRTGQVGAANGESSRAWCFDFDGNDLWARGFESTTHFQGVGAAPCNDDACTGNFVVTVSEALGGRAHRIVRLDRATGDTVADIPLDAANRLEASGLRRLAVETAMVAGNERTVLYGSAGGGLRRSWLDWGTGEQGFDDVHPGFSMIIRDRTGETCAWSWTSRVLRLDGALGTIWESDAVETGSGLGRERIHDLHVVGADSAQRSDDGYALVGSREDGIYESRFVPWVARLDDRGFPVWSRLLRTIGESDPQAEQFRDPRRRTAASALLADGSIVVAHPASAFVYLTCIRGDGTAAWRTSLDAPWPGLELPQLFALGSTGPSELTTVSEADPDSPGRSFDVKALDGDGTLIGYLSVRFGESLAGPGTPRYEAVGRAAVIDERGILLAGPVWLPTDPSSSALVPHVCLVDIAPDGTLRHASMHRWDAEWHLEAASFHVARGSGGEVYVGATITDAFDTPRPGGRDWVLMRASEDGAWEWAQAYGGLLNETLTAVRSVPGGGALLLGRSDSVDVRGDAWALRVGPDGRIAASGGCQAERERVEAGETIALDVEVSVRGEGLGGGSQLPPFDDLVEVGTPSSPVTDTVVARQCLGFSTPPPDPGEGPPPPGPGPATGGILFASVRDGGIDKEIWSVETSGANARRLTDNDWDDLDPAWSPDGTQIAFVADRDAGTDFEVYVMPAAGGEPTKVSDFAALGLSASTPAWSPDRTQLVVAASERDGFPVGLRLLTIASGAVEVLTSDPGDRFPAWAPGSKILFARDDGIYEAPPVVNALGRRLVSEFPVGGPAWSPQADRIAFGRYDVGILKTRLAVMNADGSGLTSLTSGGNQIADVGPTWFAGGSRIAFVRGDALNNKLWTLDPSGENADVAIVPGQQGSVFGEPDAR